MSITKSPWTYSPQKGEQGHCFAAQVWDAEGFSLAYVDSTKNPEESTSNARLMAAAPELLEALEEAIIEFNGLPHSLGYDITHAKKWQSLVNKAKGY